MQANNETRSSLKCFFSLFFKLWSYSVKKVLRKEDQENCEREETWDFLLSFIVINREYKVLILKFRFLS